MDEQGEMNEAQAAGRASRRQVLAGMGLLGAAGAAGAAGVLGVTGATAAGAAPAPGTTGPVVAGGSAPASVNDGPVTSAFPGDTAGLTYSVVGPYWFVPQQWANGLAFSGTGVYTNLSAGFVVAPVSLPVGAIIKEWSGTAVNNSGSSQTMGMEAFNAGTGSDTGLGFPTMTFPSTGVTQQTQTVTLTTPHTVTSGEAVNVFGFTPTNGTFQVFGARIGYVAPAPGFHPLTPARVYDSRWNPAPAGVTTGPLVQPNTRIVSVANGRDLTTGAVNAANLVPAGASGITYNLTVVPTTASGFLAITPGNAPSYAASAINWNAVGAAVANGGVVTLDGSRQVKLFAAGGTDFIIDVTGYYI